MQVALHFGAPYTDENRLQLCLGKNREKLAEVGTIIPRPSSYRRSLRPILARANDVADTTDLRAEFLQDIVGDQDAQRLVFTNDTFLGIPRLSVAKDQFFPGPFNRLAGFLRLFEGHDVEVFYAIRNPATFLQNLVRDHPGEDIDTLIGHSAPHLLRWSDFLHRIRLDCPTVPITVWCNEDSPLVWDDVLRRVTGVPADFALEGTYELLQEIMTAEGYSRFIEYLDKRPNLTQDQKKRVIIAFLDKFADDDALEEEVDFPGWTEEAVDLLTDIYDEDVDEIQNMPGITLLTP